MGTFLGKQKAAGPGACRFWTGDKGLVLCEARRKGVGLKPPSLSFWISCGTTEIVPLRTFPPRQTLSTSKKRQALGPAAGIARRAEKVLELLAGPGGS
jgi:hypothetical protein